MLYNVDFPWVVLFGGCNRQKSIIAMKNHGYEIRLVFVPKKREPRLDASIQDLLDAEIQVCELTTADIENSLREFQGTNLLSIGFPLLLKKSVLDLFQLRLNIHPTLLPKYRGPNSGAYVILNGEKRAGSTVHFMNDEPDDGPLVRQAAVALTTFDTTKSMQRKVYEIEPNLILEALADIGKGYLGEPQKQSEASSYKRRYPEDSEVDPSKNLLQLYDEIRSADALSYPAFFYVEGEKVCIKLWRPNKPDSEYDLI